MTVTRFLVSVVLLAGAMGLVACDDGPPQWKEGAVLTASDVTGSSVKLAWTLPDDKDGLSAIRIKKGDEVVAELGAGNQSYTAENLDGNTEYAFSVEVSDMKGKWSQPIVAKAKTLDGKPPVWAEDAALEIDVESRGMLGSRVTFTWSPEPTDDVGVTQYKLMQESQLEPEEIAVFPATEKEYVHQSVDVDGRFVLYAGDAAGNWSESGPKVRVWANKGLKNMMQKQGFMTAPGTNRPFNAPRLQIGQ